MNWNFFKPVFEIIKFQRKHALPQTKATFRAWVDAIVPRGPSQAFGALDLHSEEYQIWTLDHLLSLKIVIKNFNIYLANATAEMLNIAARQLIYSGGNKKPINPELAHQEGTFAALEPSDRFRAVTLLEQLQVDLASLPIPFRNNPGFIHAITAVLTLLTTIGYYSEWSGYGSTRLKTPEKRKIEHFPTGWKQVGYPGPAKGYHALRGYLIKEFTEDKFTEDEYTED